MGATQSTAAFLRSPIVNPETGVPSRDFLKFLQYLVAKTDQTLSLDGQIIGEVTGTLSGPISDTAQVVGAPATLAAQIANLDAGGIVMPNGLDMTRAYVGKATANIPQSSGSFYVTNASGMKGVASIDSGNLALINFGSAHDGFQRFQLNYGSAVSSQWILLGTWSAVGQGDMLVIAWEAGSFYNSGTNTQSEQQLVAKIGNNSTAPNLTGATFVTSGGTNTVQSVKLVAHGGSTSPSNVVWDVYVEYGPFVLGYVDVEWTPGAAFSYSGASASDPGANSSTVLAAIGGQTFTADANLSNRVNQYDPGGVLRVPGLVNYHNISSWPDGGGKYAAVEASADHTANHATWFIEVFQSGLTLTGGSVVSTSGYGVNFYSGTNGSGSATLAIPISAPATDAVQIIFYLDGVAISGVDQWYYIPRANVGSTVTFVCPLQALSAASHTLEVYYKYAGTTGNGFFEVPVVLSGQVVF